MKQNVNDTWSLKALRANKNLTLKEAAKVLGVSVTTLWRWENGITFPTQYWIEKICQFYGIHYDRINFLPTVTLSADFNRTR